MTGLNTLKPHSQSTQQTNENSAGVASVGHFRGKSALVSQNTREVGKIGIGSSETSAPLRDKSNDRAMVDEYWNKVKAKFSHRASE